MAADQTVTVTVPAEARKTEPQAIQVHSKVAQSGLGRIAAGRGGRQGPATHSGLDSTEPSGPGGREEKWQIIVNCRVLLWAEKSGGLPRAGRLL